MTNEGTKPTEAWARKNEYQPGYAYDAKGQLMRHFSVRGIPHAVLVDPGGTVVWRGHPAGLDEPTIEKALEGALATPIYEWPEEAKGVRKALLGGKLEEALSAAKKVGPAYVEIVQGRVDALRDGVVKAYEAGDFLGAERKGERARKLLDDLPEAEQVEQVLRKVREDDAAQATLKLQEKVAELLQEGRELNSKKKVRAVIEELREFIAEHSGTIVETQGQAAIQELKDRIGS